MSAEATVSRNYLDWLIAVPWHKKTRRSRDLEARRGDPQRGPLRAREDQGAHPRVPRRAPAGQEAEGTILCFSGPPGVGKTSLAKSIARAMNRKFVRLSLGGVRDEAEIRGHRRTYIGAFPGQIIQMMKKAGTREPGVPARRSRQDVDGLPRRPVGGAARGARPRAEQHVPRSLPRRRVRPVERDVHLHGQRAAHDPAGAARPHGSAAARRLHRAGEDRDRQAVPRPEGDRGRRPRRRTTSPSPTRRSRRSSSATRARRASATSSARSRRSAARSRARSSSRARTFTRGDHGRRRSRSTSACRASATDGGRDATRSASPRPGLDRGRRRDPGDRSDADARQGHADAHRQARRRDAGVGAGGDELRALAGRAEISASEGLQPRRPTSTSTCRKARSRRTARRPASRSRRRSSRR